MKIATQEEKALIVQILTSSFKENKSVLSVCRNNLDNVPLLMDYSFDECLDFGKIFVSDDKKSCCLVLNPMKKKVTLKSIKRDLKLIKNVIGIANVPSVIKRDKLIKKHHPKEPHYHLWYIGVEENSMGQGIGTKLIKEVQSYYQDKGHPIVLETSTERNYPFYERNGFKREHLIDKELPYRLTIFKHR